MPPEQNEWCQTTTPGTSRIVCGFFNVPCKCPCLRKCSRGWKCGSADFDETCLLSIMACGRFCLISVAYAVFLPLVVGLKHNTTKKLTKERKNITIWMKSSFGGWAMVFLLQIQNTGFIERVNGNLPSTSRMLIKLGQHITASDQRSSIFKNVSRIFCKHEKKINTFHSMKKTKEI